MDQLSTILLYIAIFASTTILANFSQKISKFGIKYRKGYLFASFFIHWIFLSFTSIGADYISYYEIIDRLGTSNSYDGVEIGFSVLCLSLKKIVISPHLVIFLLKTITILIFYKGFYLIKNQSNLTLSVFAFNMLLFLQGIYLLSMQMAIALLFVSFIYLLNAKNTHSIVYLIFAILIHYSSLLLVPIYLIYYFGNIGGYRINRLTIFFLVLFIAGVLYFYVDIYVYFTSNFTPFKHYSNYELKNDSDVIAIGQILFFIPLLYFAFQIYKSDMNNNIKNAAVVFIIIAFGYAILGYKIDVLTRINMSFFPIYAILIPLLLTNRKKREIKVLTRLKLSYRVDTSIWFVYLLLRGYNVLSVYMSPNSVSQLSNYELFWPF